MAFRKAKLSVTMLAIAGITLGAITGCNQQSTPTKSEASIDQANLCEVSDWQHDAVANACKPGQKVVFLPQSFGNEQLPIIFAAVNCDLRFNVALTKGAVTCIYNPITLTKPKEAPATASKPQ